MVICLDCDGIWIWYFSGQYGLLQIEICGQNWEPGTGNQGQKVQLVTIRALDAALRLASYSVDRLLIGLRGEESI